MDSQKTLSDIAKSVINNEGENSKTLREKAGVLALINLLGIMESFFGQESVSKETLRVVADALSIPKEPETKTVSLSNTQSTSSSVSGETGNVNEDNPFGGMGNSPLNLIGTLAKLMGGPPSVTQGDEKNQSFDPALISTLMTLLASIGKKGPKQSKPSAKSEAKEGEHGLETSDEESTTDETTQEISPLQQFLGVDPKVLTLILNFLAGLDFMKNRREDQKTDEIPTQSSYAPPKQEPRDETREVVVPSNVRRLPSRDKVYHKPGLGIYRSRLGPETRHGRAIT
jgi:hypothetical protein